MTFKLFSILFAVIISLLLFSFGTIMILYINAEPNYAINRVNTAYSDSEGGILAALVEPFKASLDSLKVENQNTNILLLGGDFVGTNTDTMIVVNINPLKRTVKFLSIPRDTRVSSSTGYHKINYAYTLGGGRVASTFVENLLKIKVDYYVFVNINTFKYIIDTLDGVEFNVPEDMDYDDPTQELHIHLSKGLQTLNGTQSEGFMRFRQYNHGKVTENYDGSDLLRIKSQQAFIKEFIKQKSNLYAVTKFKDILEIVLKNMDTNLNLNDILKLLSYSSSFDLEDIKMLTLPGNAEEGDSWYYLIDDGLTKELLIKESFDILEN